MKLQNLSTRTFLRLMVGGASLTSIVVPPLCFHKRYKGDTWRFQCDDSSIFLGSSLFALFSKETIGLYRWTMPDIR